MGPGRALAAAMLCFTAGAAALLYLPFEWQAQARHFEDTEPFYSSPIDYPDGRLLIRSDSYGKGYFGASRNKGRKHKGLDLYAVVGTEIRAPKSGRVSVVETEKGYGLWVEVTHPDGLRTRYAHLSAVEVRVGDWLPRGKTLGRVGKTGNAINPHIVPHLHFEIRYDHFALDPSDKLLHPGLVLAPA